MRCRPLMLSESRYSGSQRNEEPAKIGGYGTINCTGPAGRIVVHVQGALHMVRALAAHRALIDDAAMQTLLAAMLDMIAEPENLISNRAALSGTLREFVDRVPTALEQRAVEVLEPLAMGVIAEPSRLQSHTEATNPLNPIKMASGNPIDLHGAALMLLCKLDRDRPNICPALHDGILLGAITGADAEVRRYALYAASEGGNLTPMERAAIAPCRSRSGSSCSGTCDPRNDQVQGHREHGCHHLADRSPLN